MLEKFELQTDTLYMTTTGKILKVKIVEAPDGGDYKFMGRYHGAIYPQRYDIDGKAEETATSKYYGDIARKIISEEEIVDSLWNQPGMSVDDLLADITDDNEKLYVRQEMLERLITEGRVSVLRFTTYAPNLKTTFFYFATEHGRIEIIDNKPIDFAGHQIGHVHDPMGLWDERMEAAGRL